MPWSQRLGTPWDRWWKSVNLNAILILELVLLITFCSISVGMAHAVMSVVVRFCHAPITYRNVDSAPHRTMGISQCGKVYSSISASVPTGTVSTLSLSRPGLCGSLNGHRRAPSPEYWLECGLHYPYAPYLGLIIIRCSQSHPLYKLVPDSHSTRSIV